ncbi:questin oxidase family protein [Candidatus Bathyarchaeota archaeon]|nr:questin oxidase family protein [Candidatus Bathyarchaeota archaeon]
MSHGQIVHHLLSLYSCGAEPPALRKAYDVNDFYQRHALKPHDDLAQRLIHWSEAQECLGQEKYYPDLLRFFQNELERLGWQEALLKYLFEGSERSDDLLRRMFAGMSPWLLGPGSEA